MNHILPTMATQNAPHPTNGVAEKVLRRAEIAKVARNLQDRLALANFKAQNGWQNRTLRTIEPEITEHLRRKRPYSSGDVLSDSSSNTSEDFYFNNSSPLTGPTFSDNVLGSKYSRRSHLEDPSFKSLQNFGSRKRFRSSSNAGPPKASITGNKSWKQTHRLAQSSPVFQRPQLPYNTMPKSFVSDAATMPGSRHTRPSHFTSQTSTQDDKDDLPIHSFNQQPNSPNMIASSPPRTPSPTRRTRKPHSKESGADLLLYLANSPSRSPALNHGQQLDPSRRNGHLEPPSTPPSQHTTITSTTTSSTTPAPALPSSFLSTPTSNSTTNLPLFSTPGQQFNFADFVNVTPSPAQAPWGGRTPGLNKTPAAARAARRGLNFDALVPPPMMSPTLQRGGDVGAARKVGKGLALELGDKLMPRS